jgi:hypothetical protein
MENTGKDTNDLVLEVQAHVARSALSINWAGSSTMASPSNRRAMRRGEGESHEGFKVFDAAEDNPVHIDISQSAMHPIEDEFIVKTFRRSPSTCLSVLLKVGKSMNMGSLGMTKNTIGAVCAACGMVAADESGDRLSFISYAEAPITVIKAGIAKRVYTRALVAAVEDRQVDWTAPPAFSGNWRSRLAARARHTWQQTVEWLKNLPANFKKRWSQLSEPDTTDGGGLASAVLSARRPEKSVFLIVSDFTNMNEEDWEALEQTGAKHDVIAVFVKDRREEYLPKAPWPGVSFSLEDYRGEQITIWIAPDNSPRWYLRSLRLIFGAVTTAKQWKENWMRHEERILDRLQNCGINTLVVSTDGEDAVHELLQLLASKSRS